jgi:hypothetical protein
MVQVWCSLCWPTPTIVAHRLIVRNRSIQNRPVRHNHEGLNSYPWYPVVLRREREILNTRFRVLLPIKCSLVVVRAVIFGLRWGPIVGLRSTLSHNSTRYCRPLLRSNDKRTESCCAVRYTFTCDNPFDRRPINPHWTEISYGSTYSHVLPCLVLI